MRDSHSIAEKVNHIFKEKNRFLETEVCLTPYGTIPDIQTGFGINNYEEIVYELERGPLGRYRNILHELAFYTQNTTNQFPFYRREVKEDADILKLRILRIINEPPRDGKELLLMPYMNKSPEECAQEFLTESKAFINTLLMRPEYDALNNLIPHGLLEIILIRNLSFPKELNDSQALDLLYLLNLAHEGYMKKQANRSRYDSKMTKIFNSDAYLQIRKANILKGWQAGHYRAEIQWDLNGLKDVNDKFGHYVGDQYLYFVGEAISETILQYKSDRSIIGEILAGRLGGDEIAIEFGLSNNDHDLINKISRDIKNLIVTKLQNATFVDAFNNPLYELTQKDIKACLGVRNNTYSLPGVYTFMLAARENDLENGLAQIVQAYTNAQPMITYPKLLKKKGNYDSFLKLLNEHGQYPLNQDEPVVEQEEALVSNLIELQAKKKGLSTLNSKDLEQIKIDESKIHYCLNKLNICGLSTPSQIIGYIKQDSNQLLSQDLSIVEYDPSRIDSPDSNKTIYLRYWLSEFISATGTQSSIR